MASSRKSYRIPLAFLAFVLVSAFATLPTAAAEDTAASLKSAVLAPPSPDDQFERYEKMQKLLRLAATDEAARNVVAEEVFSPHVAPDVREIVLAMCERLVRNPDFRDLFLPDYLPGLLLIRESRMATGLKPRPDSVIKGYPPDRVAAALDSIIQPLPLDVQPQTDQARAQRAAIRAMPDTELWRLPFQLDRFVPSLIGALTAINARKKPENAPDGDADVRQLIVQALQSITEMRRGIEPPDSGQRWQEWYDANLKDASELDRVLLVTRNLRANRATVEAELRDLRLNEELRAVDNGKENYEVLISFVETGRDPAVLIRALRYIGARLTSTPLPTALREQLLPKLRTCYTLLGDRDSVVAELTDTALLIQPQGEELVRTQVNTLRKPEVRAAVLLKLARGGQDKASLGVLLRVMEDWRDPEIRNVDIRVVKAALSGVAEWKQHDEVTTGQVVETLVHMINALGKAPDGADLAVDVHNAINALAPRIDTTPIVREVLKADRTVFSLTLQLVTTRVALGGKAGPPLSAFLRANERKEHLLRGLLKTNSRDSMRFELQTTLDILAALGDPFLDPPDRLMYEAAFNLYRDPGPANGDLKQRVAKCFTAFAITEASALPIGADAPAPAFQVFELLMDLGAAPMAVDEKLVDKLPDAVRTRWPDATRLLRARLGLRTPQFESSVVTIGELVKAKKVAEATQLTDLQWALTPPTPEERAMRLAALQRLVTALHPEGPENVPAHVWKALAADARARVVKDTDQPASALSALRIAYALASWEPLRPVMALETNQNLAEWRAATGEARTRVAAWQAARWRELAVGIESGKPLPEPVRAFAMDKSIGIPAVPEARFAAVPGNDAVAIPGLAQRLMDVGHDDKVAVQIWRLIEEAADARGKKIGNTWPTADNYDAVRQALLNELRTVHGYK